MLTLACLQLEFTLLKSREDAQGLLQWEAADYKPQRREMFGAAAFEHVAAGDGHSLAVVSCDSATHSTVAAAAVMDDMVSAMTELDVEVETWHAEHGTGQLEIVRFC